MTNLAIVKSTYEGRNSEENGQNLANHAAIDINWTEAKGFPYAGTYIGLEAIIENVFKRLAEEWLNYKFTPQTYISQDDKVIALGFYSGTYKTTNKYFEARVAHIWTLKNQKITDFEQIVDSHTVVKAMILNE